MKRTIGTMLVIVAAFVLGFALHASANEGINVHGPHGQSDCERSQARLSVRKAEVPAIPAGPVGFAPYTAGPITGDDGSWHVTLTGPPFAPAASGTWAGQAVTVPTFVGNLNCTPPTTTTTTTTTPPPVVVPCEADGDETDCPPIEQANEPRPTYPAPTASAVPLAAPTDAIDALPLTGAREAWLAGLAVVLIGVGLWTRPWWHRAPRGMAR